MAESNQSVCSITPTEFEKYCYEFLKSYAEKENLCDFHITHDETLSVTDGDYQIDVYAEFTALGTKFKVLCECKQYTHPVSREKVAVLHQKLISTGAHKGILISTCGFQSGAIKFAKEHGIALIRVSDHNKEHYSFSSGEPLDEKDPFYYGVQHMPPYIAELCTNSTQEWCKIYPTQSMIAKLILKTTCMLMHKG